MAKSIENYNDRRIFSRFHIFQNFENWDHECLNIMMIDDSKRDIKLAHESLKFESDLNFRLKGYTNCEEALTDLEAGVIQPNVIILDLVMPTMNGLMTLEKIKSTVKAQEIPVVIHSSMHNYDNIQEANDLNAHAFFAKSLNGEMFSAFIRGTALC